MVGDGTSLRAEFPQGRSNLSETYWETGLGRVLALNRAGMAVTRELQIERIRRAIP